MSDMKPPPLHPIEAFARIEQQLAAKVAEVQTALQLAMLDATKSASEVEHRDIKGDPSVVTRRDRLLRNTMLIVAADLLLSRLYKELK